jgi:predicted transposase YbfD/YdcC
MSRHQARLYHAAGAAPARSTIADANRDRDSKDFSGLFMHMLGMATRGLRRKVGDAARLIDSTSLHLAGPGRNGRAFPPTFAVPGRMSSVIPICSHDRAASKGPLHLASAFATTSRLVLGQEAVEAKSNEIAAIPVLLERLAEGKGIEGALVSIGAIATNAAIATAIKNAGAGYLLAVKANQPTLRAEIEGFFEDAGCDAAHVDVDLDKSHGRIEQRAGTVA